MGTDVAHAEVGGIESSSCGSHVILVVAHTSASHDERVDVEVKRSLLACRVFRGKRVHDELEVGFGLGILFVELCLHAEQLRRTDGDASLEQWHYLRAHRQACGTEQGLVLLVEQGHTVNDHASRESQVHTVYLHHGAQLGSQGVCHFRACPVLYGGDVEQDGGQGIEAHQCPYHDPDYMSKCFDVYIVLSAKLLIFSLISPLSLVFFSLLSRKRIKWYP